MEPRYDEANDSEVVRILRKITDHDEAYIRAGVYRPFAEAEAARAWLDAHDRRAAEEESRQ